MNSGGISMSQPGHDAVGMLRWGLRRYRLLFLACLLIGAAAAPFAASRLEKPADAEALVIAQRLDMDLTALPRYGETVFDNGQVAEAVSREFGAAMALENIVPDHVSLVADQDSIVFRVVGHDPDPQTAADIANTAAGTFVEALNAPGVGVGAFTLLSPAEPPPAPGAALSRLLAIGVGVAAGLVLGLAAVSLLLAGRRPVIDAAGVEEATGVPGLGTVTVPRTRQGEFAPPDQFPGLVPVCRRLLRLKTPTIVFVSRSREEGLRRQVSVALTGVLMRVREVGFTGPDELREAVEERRAAQGMRAGRHKRSDGNGAALLTVIDSNDPLDLVQPLEMTATVLVAREGISSAALRGAVLEHLGGSAEARVLLVRRGRRTRRETVPPAETAETHQVEEVALGR
jgi:capsular polysaccharide biosynthesis protein